MENVLVVNAGDVADYLGQSANCVLYDKNEPLLTRIIDKHMFLERSGAETNAGFKQVIPYLVLTHQKKILVTTRLSKQTENRLHGKMSIGIGGHINPCEAGENPIMTGLYKELNEEIAVRLQEPPVYRGIICDASAEVSKYHLGLLFIARTADDTYEVLEKDKMVARWMDIEELNQNITRMESWSRIVIENYITSILHDGEQPDFLL